VLRSKKAPIAYQTAPEPGNLTHRAAEKHDPSGRTFRRAPRAAHSVVRQRGSG